jgi:hypothetical protein
VKKNIKTSKVKRSITKPHLSYDIQKWVGMVQSQQEHAEEIKEDYPNLSRDRALEAIATACLGARSVAEDLYRNQGNVADALREACRVLELIAGEL